MMQVGFFGFVSLAFLLLACGQAEAAFRIIVTELETPLVPNSVVDLAARLGYYQRAGVDVELVRVQQTPSAVAALHSGQGDMANIGFDTALQLLARDQMKLKGVISPDKALPFVVAARRPIAEPAQLAGKIFAVSRIGAVDHSLSRIVLDRLGVDVDRLQYLAIGQPSARAIALMSGHIDATTMSIGIWSSLPDRNDLTLLVDQESFYKEAPVISKLNVVTEETARTKAKEVRAVVRAIIRASRDFAKDSESWIRAMQDARPDVPRATLMALAQAYKTEWDVNGGLNLDEAAFTTGVHYAEPDFQKLKRVSPTDWIDVSVIDSVLREDGVYPDLDLTGR